MEDILYGDEVKLLLLPSSVKQKVSNINNVGKMIEASLITNNEAFFDDRKI